MQHESATHALKTLKTTSVTDKDLARLFEDYVTLDACEIQKRAEQSIEEIDFGSVDEWDREDFFHHASMAVFNSSVIDYYTEKDWPIENFVEHDIPSWIESHAEILAESILSALDAQTDKLSSFAAIQNTVLQNLWIEIENKLHPV